jgi:predicted alpha-1,6-mannanase (GH76 family)
MLISLVDDEGWWAMAWIRAYDVTGNSTYLQTASTIFEDIRHGTGSKCGGIWWSKDKDYVASISNELYLVVAASLANRAPPSLADYITLAKVEADWIINTSGLLNSNNTLHDGLDIETCQPIGTVFTYNQGVILGGLVEVSKATGDTTYLDTANKIAHGALDHLTDSKGILTESGYPGDMDNTAEQFKGVFVRNLAILHAASPHDEYVKFLQTNADTIWQQGRVSNGEIGINWQGPYYDATMASQSSALDCLIAAAVVSQ